MAAINKMLSARALTPTERQMLQTALIAAGVDRAVIAPWLKARRYCKFNNHIDVVLEWTAAFDDAELGLAWYETDVTADEARSWSDAGYSPRQAERVAAEVFLRMLDPDWPTPYTQDHWLATGLPPEFVIRCLELGVKEPTQARDLFDLATTSAASVGLTINAEEPGAATM